MRNGSIFISPFLGGCVIITYLSSRATEGGVAISIYQCVTEIASSLRSSQ